MSSDEFFDPMGRTRALSRQVFMLSTRLRRDSTKYLKRWCEHAFASSRCLLRFIFVGSSLNATCIVILAEKEKKDTTQFKNNLSTCLENTDYFEKLSDMCAILKDPNDHSKIEESDFFFPREAKDGFKLCRRVSNTSIVNDRSMDYYILYREDPSDEADCLFYFSYLQK